MELFELIYRLVVMVALFVSGIAVGWFLKEQQDVDLSHSVSADSALPISVRVPQ
jgi:hypothetical protein